MDFRRANGSCSITCRSLSTFSIGKNASFTASKICGAMRRASRGKPRNKNADLSVAGLLLRLRRRSWFCRWRICLRHRRRGDGLALRVRRFDAHQLQLENERRIWPDLRGARLFSISEVRWDEDLELRAGLH